MKKTSIFLLSVLLPALLFAAQESKKIYVSTTGFEGLKLNSCLSDKPVFFNYRITSKEDASALIRKLTLLSPGKESDENILGYVNRIMQVRKYEKETCYVLISVTNDKNILTIEQPYRHKGGDELIFESKTVKRDEEFYQMYIRMYVVDKEKDKYKKIVDFNGVKYELTPENVENFLSRSVMPFSVMASKTGFVLLSNYSGSPYMLSIDGKDPKQQQAEQPNVMLFRVDGLIFQYTYTDISLFCKQGCDKLKDKEILEMHGKWEREYMEGQIGQKMKEKHRFRKIKGNREIFQWVVDMPVSPVSAENSVKSQYFTTARVKNVIVVMSGYVFDKKDTGRMGDKLYKIMSTLDEKDKPVTVAELREKALK